MNIRGMRSHMRYAPDPYTSILAPPCYNELKRFLPGLPAGHNDQVKDPGGFRDSLHITDDE